MESQSAKYTRAFTLLEILLVVAAIGILAGIVIFAINPAKQLADTRNAQRRVDVNTILNAVYQYVIDNNGGFPTEIPELATQICKTTAPGCDGVTLSGLTTDAKYLVAIPIDPSTTDAQRAGYTIVLETSGRITVDAPLAEESEIISVTR